MREHELFEYLKKNYIEDLEPTTHEFSPVDAFSRSRKQCYELKCVKKDYDTCLIEQKKYNEMMKIREEGWEPIYIMASPSRIAVFELSKFTPKWKEKQMANTTVNLERNKRLKMKTVGFLHKSKGSIIHLNLNTNGK